MFLNLVSLVVWYLTWLILGKFIFDWLYYRRLSLELALLEKNNIGLGLSFGGFLLGFGFALSSVLDAQIPIYFNALSGFLTIFIIFVFTRLFDWIFLRKIDFIDQVTKKGNPAAGLIEAAFFIGAGLIVSGAASGESKGFVFDWLETSIYILIGLFFLFFAYLIFSKILCFSMEKEIEKENLAVSLAYSGLFISIANIVRHAISGDIEVAPSINDILRIWGEDIFGTVLEFLFGLLIMLGLFFVFDFVLFRKASFSDELLEPNIAVGALLFAIFIFCSFIVIIIFPH